MDKQKKPNNHNIVNEIYVILFGLNGIYRTEFNFDVSSRGLDFDINQTSHNLDFSVSTFQTRSENVYFNCFLYDYETKERHDIGYFYIKDNNGLISADHLKALYLIIQTGTIITEKIFNNMEV